ncbi:XdhC family protein [Candidatus Palauibacter sp.]|uniref:XdhC family protein n=1 Tax=Candidatus Palauibacter sp. TaxID=3101350 RepID=UPI003C6FF6A1
MSLRDVREDITRWAGRGDPIAIATLIAVRRSAPRPPGARFAISGTGELAGSISSGCVEGDLHERLTALLGGGAPATVTYGITDEMAAGVGLSCGGEIDVLLDPYDPGDPVWHRLWQLQEAGAPSVLLTGAAASTRSRHLLLEADRSLGTLGSAEFDRRARSRVNEWLDRSDAQVVELVRGDPESAVFVESFVPPPRLVIVGATPIAHALCAMAARTGFEVLVVDPREAFLRPERFPGAAALDARWPDEALEALDLDPRTSVVTLTHDDKLDEPALESALASRCGYVGLLGGRRTQRKRREALRARGLDEATCDRIHGPVGLDIGARTPEQIAVSILAQLIALGRAP